MPIELVNLEVLPNGDLKITLTEAGRAHLKHMQEKMLDDDNQVHRLLDALDDTDVLIGNGLVMGPRTLHNTMISREIRWIRDLSQNDEDMFRTLVLDTDGWDFVEPEDVEALTDSLLLSNDVTYTENGDFHGCNHIWYFDRYMIDSYTQDLEAQGYVIWLKGWND